MDMVGGREDERYGQSNMEIYIIIYKTYQFSSVQFSSVAQSCPTLRRHGLQGVRPGCPSPTPGVYADSCPLSW